MAAGKAKSSRALMWGRGNTPAVSRRLGLELRRQSEVRKGRQHKRTCAQRRRGWPRVVGHLPVVASFIDAETTGGCVTALLWWRSARLSTRLWCVLHRAFDLSVSSCVAVRQAGRRAMSALDVRYDLRVVRPPGASRDVRRPSAGARDVRLLGRRGHGHARALGAVDRASSRPRRGGECAVAG